MWPRHCRASSEGMIRGPLGTTWEPDRRLYRAYAADSSLNTGHVNDPTLSDMVKAQRRIKDIEERRQLHLRHSAL